MPIAIASAASTSSSTQAKAIPSLKAPTTLSSIARAAAGTVLVALAAGCASPPKDASASAPALICPPPERLVCPTVPPPTPAPTAADYRGRLQPAAWIDLPDWGREGLRSALEAFTRSCPVLEKQDAWKAVCAGAQTLLPAASEREVASFFELNFDPWQVLNADDSATGMVTGYYEPLLRGSRARSERFRYPLYAVPQDLVVVDLASLYPELKHRRLRGRVEGNRVVPYFSRGDIDRDGGPLKGLELAWVEDPVDLFFLHIQGSGQVEL